MNKFMSWSYIDYDDAIFNLLTNWITIRCLNATASQCLFRMHVCKPLASSATTNLRRDQMHHRLSSILISWSGVFQLKCGCVSDRGTYNSISRTRTHSIAERTCSAISDDGNWDAVISSTFDQPARSSRTFHTRFTARSNHNFVTYSFSNWIILPILSSHLQLSFTRMSINRSNALHYYSLIRTKWAYCNDFRFDTNTNKFYCVHIGLGSRHVVVIVGRVNDEKKKIKK